MEKKSGRNSGGSNDDDGNTGQTVAVTAKDVLLGRGNLVNNSAGNQMFRSLIKENAGKYVKAASRAQKELIAKQILHQIEQYGGRFMRPVEGSSILPSWEVVSDEIALSKARQALRDMAQQLGQKPTGEAAMPRTEEEMEGPGFASLGQSTGDDDLVESLLQQIQRCRQESAEQSVRLRALLVECETAVATDSLGLPITSLDSAVLRRDGLALGDARYARVLQAREFQEELDQLRRRDADLSRGEGFARLVDSQRYREDELVRLHNEQAAFRQYQSLADFQQSNIFPSPYTHGSLRPDSSVIDRYPLSFGLSRIVDPTSLDLMLRGQYPESFLGASLLSPAGRQGGLLESQLPGGNEQEGRVGRASECTSEDQKSEEDLNGTPMKSEDQKPESD